MDIFNVLSMIGGLSLFLFGMNVMGDALGKMSGGKLERILEKLTTNKFMAVLLGMGVTAIIQSSSATTVMVVGFVNSGIMKLKQAIGIILGANIGTTVTSWILSLSGISGDSLLLKLLKPTSFSPILAVIGVVFVVFCKSEKKHNIGNIFLGFAVLMYGMDMMSTAVKPLAAVPEFTHILTMFSNPILGLLAGAVLTAIIQSSSASVGILQALCATGAITYGSAIPIILGQNIGTCVTAALSSIGASRDAKRAAAVHFYFNIIGTTIFMIGFYSVNLFVDFKFLNDVTNPANIALIHSAFNICATLILLPLSGFLEFLACKTIKDKTKPEEEEHDQALQLLDPLFLDKPGFAIMQCKEVAKKMFEISRDGLFESISLIDNYDATKNENIRYLEDVVDQYEDKLGTYLLRLSGKDLAKEDGHTLSVLLHSIGDIERISDHSIDILLALERMNEKNLSFSPKAYEELNVYKKALTDIVDMTVDAFTNNDHGLAEMVLPLEDAIDDMNIELKKRHVKRLRKGKCTIELGLSLSDISDVFERVSDHCSNIASYIIQVEEDDALSHGHNAKREMKSSDEKWIKARYEDYLAKYSLPNTK